MRGSESWWLMCMHVYPPIEGALAMTCICVFTPTLDRWTV